jgi:NADH-quinone oxidoreductase subunit J
MLDTAFFYTFALLAIGGAIATVTRRSAVHSALSLIVSLLGVAGLFLLLQAEFLFAVQIVLYIGGIVVLFLFVIMLVNLDEAARQRQFSRTWALGALCALLVGVQTVALLAGSGWLRLPPAVTPSAPKGNVEGLADVLFSRYLLPFELVSLLLLAAIAGSVLLARRRT